jgi:hypothetical protein
MISLVSRILSGITTSNKHVEFAEACEIPAALVTG